ncbi:MAG: hypothetical protein ACOZQL_11265 [Myxococcota bacterium]
MDLWQVRKRYRQLAARLRRVEGNGLLREAEQEVVESLLIADRLETELAVLRFTKKCALGRLGRVRAWLEHTSLLKEAPDSLFDAPDEPELFLSSLGAAGLASLLGQLQLELKVLEHRSRELQQRLTRLGEVAAGHYLRLEARLRAERLEPAEIGG